MRCVFDPCARDRTRLDGFVSAVFKELVLAGHYDDQIRLIPQDLLDKRGETIAGVRDAAAIDCFIVACRVNARELDLQPFGKGGVA